MKKRAKPARGQNGRFVKPSLRDKYGRFADQDGEAVPKALPPRGERGHFVKPPQGYVFLEDVDFEDYV